MKAAIIGSRNVPFQDFVKYLPCDITEIVSGETKESGSPAWENAKRKRIKVTAILPDYEQHGSAAPFKRNMQIIEYVDVIIAFWDGKNDVTRAVIEAAYKINKNISVIVIDWKA